NSGTDAPAISSLNIQMSHIHCILSHRNRSLFKFRHDALRDPFPHSKCPDKVLAMLLIPARMPLQYPPLNIQMSHRKLCICTYLLLHVPTMQRFPSDEVYGQVYILVSMSSLRSVWFFSRGKEH